MKNAKTANPPFFVRKNVKEALFGETVDIS